MDLFEIRDRIERTERGFLVGVEWTDRRGPELEAQESLSELSALADTAGVEVVCQALQARARPDPATLIGAGKIEELRVLNEEIRADVFLFDDELTPGQIRNLEGALDAKVLDRTDVILDIFAQRARTKEARLQVELAQLEHMFPRLRGGWTHLSRLGGGSGVHGGVGTRGPGETQLEMDRRLIQGRIRQLKKGLRDVERHRRVQRSGRDESFGISLVGYTNAGKSSLLNSLLGSRHADVEDKLFKTLDPISRRLELSDGRAAVLTDTVGFIRRLPHQLVAAFHSSLEEVLEAELLVHVVDVAHPSVLEHIQAVQSILGELGADELPSVLVLNKVDLVTNEADLYEMIAEHPDAIPVSAATGEGIDALREEMSLRVGAQEREYLFRLSHADGRLLSTGTPI